MLQHPARLIKPNQLEIGKCQRKHERHADQWVVYGKRLSEDAPQGGCAHRRNQTIGRHQKTGLRKVEVKPSQPLEGKR